MEKIKLDVTIIGGGIVGLTVAYELKKKFSMRDVAIIEGAPFLGDHSSGRNSGVLHAGLYYKTNSLKHLLCLEGIHIWKKDLCPNLGIEFQECGKILFAENLNEEEGLHEIWKNAHENGVKGLKWCDSNTLKNISHFVHAQKAFFSPETGILDVTGAVKKISEAFISIGGMISKNTKVTSLQRNDGFLLKTNDFEIQSKIIINAAGLESVEIRKQLRLNDLEAVFVKGNYLSTSQKIHHPHLFYPVPPKDLKGLGVHSTIDLEGRIKFGPNTEDVFVIDYSDSGMALTTMVPEIMKTFKGIDQSRLYWDYSGIRSKIKNSKTEKIETDFLIQSPIPGYIECLGIESPGLTSAPAIARYIERTFL